MKTRGFFSRLAAVLIASAISFSALTYTSSSKIHADSTQQQLEAKLDDIAKKQKELDSAIKETNGDISKEKENQKSIDEQITTTEDYIRTLTDLIRDYDSQIEGLEAEISDRESDIEATQKKIDDKKLEIDENIELYKKRLRAMYLSGNDSVASILLGADNFFDMLMKIEFVKRIANYNNSLIDDLSELTKSYENDKLELENKVSDLENVKSSVAQKKNEVQLRKDEWDAQLDSLNELYTKSKKAIKELQNLKESYEENKEDLEKEKEKIEKEIQDLIREKSRAEYIGDLPEGTFLWPVPGFYHIFSPYGYRDGEYHKGIDISSAGIRGAEVTAANSGIVIKVYNGCTHDYGKSKSCGCGGGFGNYCIIDHGGGFATLYGHTQKIIVKEGQHVTTGDVLGYVGTTGWSTGNHLHFEVRVNGDRVNPENYNLIKK